MKVKIKKLNEDAIIPTYATEGSAGCDLSSLVSVTIAPGETKIIPTGLAVAIPVGYEMQIRPRSGLSYRSKLRIANSPGTIDSDYRGEVGIIVENIHRAHEDFVIKKGQKIAQAIIAPIKQAVFSVVDDLDETERGSGGYGSTDRVTGTPAKQPLVTEITTTKGEE